MPWKIADTCFYVANAKRVIGKDGDILNPPPDVVVEVDKSNQSLHKFPIYATFGVPEIWRCDVRRSRIVMYELSAGSYVEIPGIYQIKGPKFLLDMLAMAQGIEQGIAIISPGCSRCSFR